MESVMPMNGFMDLTEEELMMIDGGVNWLGVVSGASGVLGGVAGILGGVAALAVPEPTLLTKVAGYTGIVSGVSAVGTGIATIYTSWKE
jgi:succinate-acetate transporter protein